MCESVSTGWQNSMSRGCLAGRPYPRDTRERQLSPSVLTLRIPACARHMLHFAGSLVATYPRDSISFHFA